MPLFEYYCATCDKTLELLQKKGEGTPDKCPDCDAANSLTKQIALSSFQLKGSGWYKDLYSSKKED
jgi:putative FmdB family regulatory protein